MKKYLQKIAAKILKVELEGTLVRNKRTGENDTIKETNVNIGLELPLFYVSFNVKYTLCG